eukprot:275653-Amphidinium_carterae.1
MPERHGKALGRARSTSCRCGVGCDSLLGDGSADNFHAHTPLSPLAYGEDEGSVQSSPKSTKTS